MNESQAPSSTNVTRFDIFEKIKQAQTSIQLVLTLAGVVIVIAGFWIASLLSPLVQDIRILQIRADQQDDHDKRVESYLERLEGKVDRLIEKQGEK